MIGIKKLEIVFENCEWVNVPLNCIGEFHIGGIHREISRHASNSIDKTTLASEVVMEFFKKGDVPYLPFGMESEKTTVLDRLGRYNDITGIEIEYDDGSIDVLHPVWGEGECSNEYQKSYVSNLGNLYIVIDKNKDIFDYFDKEDINDKEMVEFTEDMYDIGVEDEPEHPYNKDSLPEMYRYVYLYDDDDNSSLAVRVFDAQSGFKYIYGNDEDVVVCPTHFSYPTEPIDKFLTEEPEWHSDGLDILQIISEHKRMLDSVKKDVSTVHQKYYDEAWEAIKQAEERIQ